MDQSSASSFKCKEKDCDRKFTRNANLLKHVSREHHKGNNIPELIWLPPKVDQPSSITFTCEEKDCYRQFTSKANLLEHVSHEHDKGNNIPKLIWLLPKMDQPSTSSFRCKEKDCDRTFTKKVNLLEHVSREHQKGNNIPKLIWLSPKMNQRSKNCFKCKEKDCDRKFTRKVNLLEHYSRKHRQGNIPKFICYHCNKNFSSKHSLKRHVAICQTLKDESRITSKPYECPMCTYQTKLKEVMLKHYREEHNIDLTPEILKFGSFTEFEQWKQNYETENICKYVKHACRKTKNNIVRYYRCHRDGFFKSSGKNVRCMRKGTNKINGYCPAKLEVSICNRNGEVQVSLLKSHVGHEMDLGRIPLSSAERESIAQKLCQKIPFDEVLNNIRDNVSRTEKLERIHLLTRKDLYNIEQTFNLKNEAVRHSNDSVSIDAWVKYMNEHNCDSVVRFYKKQGETNEKYTELKENDFMLIIMNDTQLDALRNYGNDCICVDVIHGLNVYDFKLNTVMVLDDLQQAFPCLFAFCNRSDKHIFKIVFEIMRDCLGYILKPQVFMSDMAEAYYNGWTAVMGAVQTRLYCTWHVLNAWNKNIREKIKEKEKQTFTFDTLRTLLEQPEENAFEQMFMKFMKNSKIDPQLQDLHKYFFSDSKYVKTRKCWAYCYRNHNGLNTNTSLELMHQTLKYIYLEGRTVKQVDIAINAVMKMIREKLSQWLIILNKGESTTTITTLRKSHTNIYSLQDSTILQAKLNQWIVSSPDGTQMYTIEKTGSTCSCDLKCSDCNACIHAYYCTCPDSSINWNMCKHIHFFLQHIQINNHNNRLYDTTNANMDMELNESYCDTLIYPSNEYSNESYQNTENISIIVGDSEGIEPEKVFQHIISPQKTVFGKETNVEEAKMKIMNTFNSIFSRIQTIEDCEIFHIGLVPISISIAVNQEANSRGKSKLATTTPKRTIKRERYNGPLQV